MESKELLQEFLLETLNISAEEVAALYNTDGKLKDDAKQTILNLDAERVKTLKSTTTKITETDAYKKATADVMTKFENDFKTKTGFKSDKKGVDLVLDYATEKAKANGEVTEDVIKKHPLYLTMQEQKDAEIKKALEEGETKLTGFQKELSKKETFNKVSSEASKIFHSLKPILSKDPVKAKTQEEDFIAKFRDFDFEIQGERIVVLKDGKVLENANGKTVAFENLIKETGLKYFDVHIVDPKQNAGNHTTNAGDKKVYDVPKTQEEYEKLISDSSIPLETRNEMAKAYESK